MADYAQNWTYRVKMRYSVQSRVHNMVVRGDLTPPPGGPTGISTKVLAFLNAISARLYEDFTVLGWSFCNPGGLFFVPFSEMTPTIGGVAIAGRPATQQAVMTRYESRGADGSRTALVLYGWNWSLQTGASENDFRVSVAEDATVSDGHTALTELAPTFHNGSGSIANWYPYVNIRFSDDGIQHLRG